MSVWQPDKNDQCFGHFFRPGVLPVHYHLFSEKNKHAWTSCACFSSSRVFPLGSLVSSRLPATLHLMDWWLELCAWALTCVHGSVCVCVQAVIARHNQCSQERLGLDPARLWLGQSAHVCRRGWIEVSSECSTALWCSSPLRLITCSFL